MKLIQLQSSTFYDNSKTDAFFVIQIVQIQKWALI